MRLDQLNTKYYIDLMKFLIIAFIFSFNTFSAERNYSCKVYAIERHTAVLSGEFHDSSTRGSLTACRLAKKKCTKYVEANKSTPMFCYEDSEHLTTYDIRYKGGAKLYYLGELKGQYNALCYGTSKQEAGAYCRDLVMNRCEDYVIAQPEEDWYCSFY